MRLAVLWQGKETQHCCEQTGGCAEKKDDAPGEVLDQKAAEGKGNNLAGRRADGPQPEGQAPLVPGKRLHEND